MGAFGVEMRQPIDAFDRVEKRKTRRRLSFVTDRLKKLVMRYCKTAIGPQATAGLPGYPSASSMTTSSSSISPVGLKPSER